MMPETIDKAETFIPLDIVEIFTVLERDNGYGSKEQYNKWLSANRPNVPKSTRTRWVRAWASGKSHSNTPSWHLHYRDYDSVVPDHFSDLKNGKIAGEREKWSKKKEIRYVNMSDFHRPFGDGTLLTLGLQIVKDFEPTIFPCFSDWLDMDRFTRHPPKPGTNGSRFLNDTPEVEERAGQNINRLAELKNLSLETIALVKSAVPEDCSLINLWGNHEQWLLKLLLSTLGENDVLDFGQYFIDDYFTLLANQGVLWVEGEVNHWFPVTREFWIGHGHRSRGGTGRTAASYLASLKHSTSVAVGHTHRQEVVYSPVPYNGFRFAAVAGTFGDIQSNYANREFLGHNWGFQLIIHPLKGSKGAHVEDIKIDYQDGYYITHAFGKEYSQPAGVKYDEFMDFI